MKLEAVVEQLQKQQQQQPAVQMDPRERRERQLREAQVPFPQQLAVQRAVLAASSRAPPASPGASLARAPPPLGAARAFDQSSMNSEPDEEEEEEEEEEEDDDEEEEEEEGGLEGGELDGADVPGKESCSALKYFRAPKVAHPNQRVASTSNPLPAPGHQRGGQQGKEEQGKDTTKQLHSGSPAGRPNWRLDEQLKQNGSVTWSDDGDGCRGREISRDFAKLYELDSDPERKEFLDDLFIFMQKREISIARWASSFTQLRIGIFHFGAVGLLYPWKGSVFVQDIPLEKSFAGEDLRVRAMVDWERLLSREAALFI